MLIYYPQTQQPNCIHLLKILNIQYIILSPPYFSYFLILHFLYFISLFLSSQPSYFLLALLPQNPLHPLSLFLSTQLQPLSYESTPPPSNFLTIISPFYFIYPFPKFVSYSSYGFNYICSNFHLYPTLPLALSFLPLIAS